MPDQNILFKLSADERRVIKAFRNIADSTTKASKETKKLTADTRKLEQESKKLEEQAARVWQKAMSPMQKYKAGTKEATKLLIKKKLTTEQYRQVNKSLQRTLQKELGLTAAAARGARRRAERLREVAAASRKADIAAQRAFGGMLVTARGLLSSLGLVGGVAGAVQLVRMEFDRLTESRERARDVSLPLADAERAALINLGADTPVEREVALAQANAISNRLRIPRQAILEGASESLSARGSFPAKLALEATAAAIQSFPHDQGASSAMAGAALDVTKMGEGITAKEGVGFLKEGIIRSRVTDPEKFAVAAPQAINTAVARGATPREGLALFAALTQGMVEKMGRRAGTAAAQLAEQLAKPTMPKGDTPEAIEARTELAKLEAQPGLGASLQFLRDNARAREIFIEGTSIQEKAKASVEQLLSGGSGGIDVLNEFRTNVRELPRAAEAGPNFERQIRIESDTDLQRTAAFSLGVKQAAESIAISDPTAARLGIIQEEFGPILEQTGLPRVATKLKNVLNVAGGELEGFAKSLAFQAEQLEHPRERDLGRGGPGFQTGRLPTRPREPTAVETKQAEALRSLVALIREVDADQKARDIQQKPAGLLPQPRQRTGPQVQSPLRTIPAIQEQQSRLGGFFVPLTEPTSPGSTESRRRPDAKHLTPPGSPTLLTTDSQSTPSVRAPQPATRTGSGGVVAAVNRMTQATTQGNVESNLSSAETNRLLNEMQERTGVNTSEPMFFDGPTLGSPGSRDVNDPADPEDR